MTSLYQVISYNPILNVCDLAPAGQGGQGILRGVPIGCFWGGSWQAQVRHRPPLPRRASPEQWGEAVGGPRWGVVFPVQLGDYCEVDFLDGDLTSAVIIAFCPGWRGNPGPAYVGEQFGESTQDRFDLLLPSGGWARCLGDGTWLISAAPVGQGPVVRISADGSVTVQADNVAIAASSILFEGSVAVNGALSVQGDTTVNGKGVMVQGGVDSAGDVMVSTGQ